MTDQSLRCKQCKTIDSVRSMALEVVDYSLVVSHGKICVGHADTTDYKLADRLGMSPSSIFYCDECKTKLDPDEYEIVWVDHDSGIEVVRTRDEVVHHACVEFVVEKLVEAGVEATHEHNDYISFDLNNNYFVWGCSDKTWGADVDDADHFATVGSIATCVPSDSTDAYLIFSVIYLRSTQFKGE